MVRRARRWFNEQGGGEGVESEDETDWYWPDGDDPVSSLPRKISVMVDLLTNVVHIFTNCHLICRYLD